MNLLARLPSAPLSLPALFTAITTAAQRLRALGRK